MLRQKILRLLVRLVILTTLAGALFFTASDARRNTVRARDCAECDAYYWACLETSLSKNPLA